MSCLRAECLMYVFTIDNQPLEEVISLVVNDSEILTCVKVE